jgi:hypothetical protein
VRAVDELWANVFYGRALIEHGGQVPGLEPEKTPSHNSICGSSCKHIAYGRTSIGAVESPEYDIMSNSLLGDPLGLIREKCARLC